MQFSVVIPTYKRVDLLSKCLKCLEPYLHPSGMVRRGFSVEVIVSDDDPASSAANELQEEYPMVVWNAGPSRGPAANRNSGANAASGSCLIFLDDDCLPQAGWIEAYVCHYQKGCLLEGKTTSDRQRRAFNEECPLNESGGYLWSCNFAICRELFREYQGFDETYVHAAMEDVDLRERLFADGVTPKFIPEAVVIHPWRKVHGLVMLKRRLKSHDTYWAKHPQLAPSSRFGYFSKNCLRVFIKRTLGQLIKFRGRGILYQLTNDMYRAYWALKNIGR